jgi:Flp pilus assembly protein TadB
MMVILYTLAALFLFTIIVGPIVMMIILLIRTNKPKQTPNSSVKLEQLEQNDYNIVDDVNKAFHDVSQSLTELQKRLDDIEDKLERKENTVKGFNSKR